MAELKVCKDIVLTINNVLSIIDSLLYIPLTINKGVGKVSVSSNYLGGRVKMSLLI